MCKLKLHCRCVVLDDIFQLQLKIVCLSVCVCVCVPLFLGEVVLILSSSVSRFRKLTKGTCFCTVVGLLLFSPTL